MLLLALARAFVGCADPEGTPRGSLSELSCLGLHQRFVTLVEPLSDTCDAVGDCTRVGGSGGYYCQGHPQLGHDPSGTPVNAAALAASTSADTIEALRAEFATRCAGATALCGSSAYCVADTAPQSVACVDHTCVNTGPSSCIAGDAGP